MTSTWQLGAVTLHSPDSGATQISAWEREETASAGRPSDSSFGRVTESLLSGTVAEVHVPGSLVGREDRTEALEEALDTVADALDLLRAFQYEQAMTQPTMFGLPGEVRRSHLQYLAAADRDEDGAAEAARSPAWAGFRNRGDVLGYTFDYQSKQTFESGPLGRLAAFIGARDLPVGPVRARLAVRLLSQAIREHRPAMRTLNSVMAVEALLGKMRTRQLAQRVVALTCGAPFEDVCGRTRDACAYLAADLTVTRENQAVDKLSKNPGDYFCSEWFEFLDRYEARSGVAHGDPTVTVTKDDADKDLYWAVKRLLPPAVTWLLDHPDDPGSALAADIRSRPVAAGAATLLGRDGNAADAP